MIKQWLRKYLGIKDVDLSDYVKKSNLDEILDLGAIFRAQDRKNALSQGDTTEKSEVGRTFYIHPDHGPQTSGGIRAKRSIRVKQ